MLAIRDTIPSRNPPLATWILILVNCVVFLFELMMPSPVLEQLFHLFGIVPARYTHPDWATWAGYAVENYWPFLTSMFLHGGLLHLVGNMWTLWIFGDNVEDRMGPVRFAIFYLICGLAAKRSDSCCFRLQTLRIYPLVASAFRLRAKRFGGPP
jgi:membrane associated rhomboid family serine protease